MKALNGMGSSYTGMGNYRKAVQLYNESLNLSKKVGDKAGQIASPLNIGNINHYKGNFGRAVELYREAMIIIKNLRISGIADPKPLHAIILAVSAYL